MKLVVSQAVFDSRSERNQYGYKSIPIEPTESMSDAVDLSLYTIEDLLIDRNGNVHKHSFYKEFIVNDLSLLRAEVSEIQGKTGEYRLWRAAQHLVDAVRCNADAFQKAHKYSADLRGIGYDQLPCFRGQENSTLVLDKKEYSMFELFLRDKSRPDSLRYLLQPENLGKSNKELEAIVTGEDRYFRLKHEYLGGGMYIEFTPEGYILLSYKGKYMGASYTKQLYVQQLQQVLGTKAIHGENPILLADLTVQAEDGSVTEAKDFVLAVTSYGNYALVERDVYTILNGQSDGVEGHINESAIKIIPSLYLMNIEDKEHRNAILDPANHVLPLIDPKCVQEIRHQFQAMSGYHEVCEEAELC